MAATATIRVPRATRDLLAAQARESSFLTKFARRGRRLDSERQATRADAASGDVAAEKRDWATVPADELLTGDEDELVVVIPLSSSRAPSSLRPPVPPTTGIDAESAAIPRAIRAVSSRRLLRRIGELEPAAIASVEEALATVLALAQSS